MQGAGQNALLKTILLMAAWNGGRYWNSNQWPSASELGHRPIPPVCAVRVSGGKVRELEAPA
jgi:hypothetical protein